MKSNNLRFWLAFTLIVFTVVTGGVTVRRTIKTSNDFDTFYRAGEAALKKEGLYYTGEYYGNTKNQGPFLYPPAAACFFALFALLPLPGAAFLWNALSISLFIFSIFLSSKILQVDIPRFIRGLGWQDKLLFSVLGFAVLLDNLAMAQVNILVFTLTLLALFFWIRAKDLQAGLWLALAVFIKLTPALFLLFFLLTKRWKVLAGFLAGAVLLTLILPSAVFGLEKNRLYHRQWLGRTLKPQLIHWVSSLKNEPQHPDKKNAEILEKDRLTTLLIDKNQSLSATLTRLFLKDRPRYGYEPQPIYAARRYEKMPVLIPLPQTGLTLAVSLAQASILFVLILATLKARPALEAVPLYFLGMTLLAPLARSHQYINWVFVYLGIFGLWKPNENAGSSWGSSFIFNAARGAAILYFLQAVPYGKAAGMGTWANLVLFMGCAAAVFVRTKTSGCLSR